MSAEAASLSLEETNKLRISLGLKPLATEPENAGEGGAEVEKSSDQLAEENYAARREQERKDAENAAARERIAKASNKRELARRLKGKTLGEDEGDDDARAWAKKLKKRQKQAAERRAEQEKEQDRLLLAREEYGEKDLKGLKVSHDLEAFEDGEERILTLKDTRILDGEDDELQNIDMAEDEKLEANTIRKKGAKAYTGYDDDEFGPDGAPRKRGVLNKYDEELGGSQETGFRLGGGAPAPKKTGWEVHAEEAAKVNKTLLDLDYIKNQEISDYLQEDVGFKKPKKKKKRSTRKAEADPDDVLAPAPAADDAMAVDEPAPQQRPKINFDEANFVDDDELQSALAKQRRAKAKKMKKRTPEELAAMLAQQQEEEAAAAATATPEPALAGDGGLEFDDTSEFIRNIALAPAPAAAPAVKREQATEAKPEVPGAASVVVKKEPEDVAIGELDESVLARGGATVEDEEEEGEVMMGEEAEVKPKVDGKEKAFTPEPTVGRGLAGTLNILRQQGALLAPTPEQLEREAVQRKRDAFIAEQRRRELLRESERAALRAADAPQMVREHENRVREQRAAQEDKEAFERAYRPDVEIAYYDEHGRKQSTKEAWKYLNYKFHGKAPGIGKREKMMKRREEEMKRLAMASGDTPLNMASAFKSRQEATGSAHFVLSVGNRGAAPQDDTFFDASAGLEKKSSRKDGGAVASTSRGRTGSVTRDFSPAPSAGTPDVLPVLASRSVSGSPAPSAPAMKPAFAPVSAAGSVSGTESPAGVGALGQKIQIGFGKRKAGESPGGEREGKRR